MIKVLFVEDSQEKLSKMVDAATSNTGLKIDSISRASTSHEAKLLLQHSYFDILFLDISIPLHLDKAAGRDEGLKLLEEIISRPGYKRPAHIIGITAFQDLYEEVKDKLQKHHVTLYRYDPTCTECEEMIHDRVISILNAKQAENEAPETYKIDLAIVCALNIPELSAVLKNGWEWTSFIFAGDSTNYYQATYYANDEERTAIAAHAPQMGMASAAVLASKMITNFRPRHIAMPGIAGGFADKANYGDVVVPDVVWDGGAGKWKELECGELIFQPEPYQHRLDPDVRSAIERLVSDPHFLSQIRFESSGAKPDTTLRLHTGPMATGAHVVASSLVRDKLLEQHRKVIAFDMEAVAIAAASEESIHPKPKWVVLKSVVDFGDKQKGDNFQEYGASTSALVLKALAESYF